MTVLGILHTIPRKLSRLTSWSAMRSIQVAAAANPTRARGTLTARGGGEERWGARRRRARPQGVETQRRRERRGREEVSCEKER